MAGAGRGQRATAAPPARSALRGPVAGRDSGRRGGRSRSRVERSREGRWWSDARTVRSYSRGGQARKTDNCVGVASPPHRPAPGSVRMTPDGSSTRPPLLTPERPGPESLDVWAVGRWRRRASFALNRIDSNRVHEHGDSSFTRSARTVAQCRECARYRIDVSASTISGHSHSLCTVSSCRASVGEDVGARNRRPCRPVQERWSHCAR